MSRTAGAWREPSAPDRCPAQMSAVARDLFHWHRRGITVRMVECDGDRGVLLGVDGGVAEVRAAAAQLRDHYPFPVTCYAFS